MMFTLVGSALILIGGVLLWRGLNIAPDAPTGEPEPRDDWDGVHVYACGCRHVGGVGDPGCADCTEPGLRA